MTTLSVLPGGAFQGSFGLLGGFTTFYQGKGTRAVSPRLPPGYYAFRVHAVNAMGPGDPSMATEVEIQPRVSRWHKVAGRG